MKDMYIMSSDNRCQCDIERGDWLKKDPDGAVTFPCGWRSTGSKCYEFGRSYVIWRFMRAIQSKLSSSAA
jgi:hypothetical protein